MDEAKGLTGILLCFIFITSNSLNAATQQSYTLINAKHYHQVVEASRLKVNWLIHALVPYRQQSRNEQLKFIIEQLLDTPYLYHGAMGEGDWQATSSVYKPGALHLQQDPVYRLDGFDCQTFVQVVIALLYAKDLDTFDQTILKIAYGAADNAGEGRVHFYNRNHFVDGDLNPVNQQNGFFEDVTTHGDLSRYAQFTSATITRLRWFAFKRHLSKETVRVLDKSQGSAMLSRLNGKYPALAMQKFVSQRVVISYLPKYSLATETQGVFHPNQALLDKIPTPAVVEMIYNHKNWNIHGKNIKDLIGTELNVAHFGLLYRQSFRYGEVIYHKITCDYHFTGPKICEVTPIHCQQDHCNELMFAHATDAYPHGYYWYRKSDGTYTCAPHPPRNDQPPRYCNRVERRPLFEYLTEKQYGSHWYMKNTALLGIHIEKLT